MREAIKEVIDGHMSITELIETVTKEERDPLRKANIINELWDELSKINNIYDKEKKRKSA